MLHLPLLHIGQVQNAFFMYFPSLQAGIAVKPYNLVNKVIRLSRLYLPTINFVNPSVQVDAFMTACKAALSVCNFATLPVDKRF